MILQSLFIMAQSCFCGVMKPHPIVREVAEDY